MLVAGLKPSLPCSRTLFIEDVFGDIAPVSLGLGATWQELQLPAPILPLGGYVIEGDEVHTFDLNMHRLLRFDEHCSAFDKVAVWF